MAGINLNMGYLKSILGILKMVEIFLLLLAFSCMSDCCYSRYYHGDSRISFFLAVTVIGWLVVIGLFVFFFLTLTERVPQVNWKLTNLITSIVLAVLLLICSSLMAERADYLRYWKNFYGNEYYNSYLGRIWNTMTAAVKFGGIISKVHNTRVVQSSNSVLEVFGFFAIVVFVIDAVFQFKDLPAGGGGGGQVSNAQTA